MNKIKLRRIIREEIQNTLRNNQPVTSSQHPTPGNCGCYGPDRYPTCGICGTPGLCDSCCGCWTANTC